MKKTTPIADLCKGHPPEFAKYLEYSRALQWEERPDYERLHQLMRSVREQMGPVDAHELEWLPEDMDVGALTAIRAWNEVDIKQPDDVQENANVSWNARASRRLSKNVSRAKCWYMSKVPLFRQQLPGGGVVAVRQSGQVMDTE